LSFSAANPALRGKYAEIHAANRDANVSYDGRLFSFVRWQGDERLIVVSNFDNEKSYELHMTLPADVVSRWQLEPGRYVLDEQLYGKNNDHLVIDEGTGTFGVRLAPLESVVYRVGRMRYGMMRDPGYIEGEDRVAQKFEGAGHSEVARNERAEVPLEFLLRARGTGQIE
jgi:hypothetical protein